MEKQKKKIIVLTMYCPFPMNYGGKVGTVSILKLLNKYFDVYLFGLRENDDVIDEKQLLQVCKCYSFYPRKKSVKQCFSALFTPYLLKTRINNDLVEDVTKCIETEHVEYLFLDSFLMYGNLKEIKINIQCFINEQNIEYLSLTSNGNAQRFPFNLFYKYQSFLLKKKEIMMIQEPKIKGISFLSFDDQEKYCKITGYDKKNTLYLPPVYNKRIGSSSLSDCSLSDVLIVGNFKYAPNIYGLRWFIDECLPFIEKERPNLRIEIIGRGLFDSFDKEELMKRKCLNPIGEVENVVPYYNGTKVVLIPLFHGGGVKIKLLEAVSYNKCVVCTSKATEGTRFDKDSLFVSDNPKEIVDCLYNALDNEELRNLKIKKATEILKNDFDAEIVSKRLFDFIVGKGAM